MEGGIVDVVCGEVGVGRVTSSSRIGLGPPRRDQISGIRAQEK